MWKVGNIFVPIMQTYEVKKGKKVINWPGQSLQARRSVALTTEERTKLVAYDEKNGYKEAMERTGLTKSTYFNILNNGFGRGNNIDKIKALLK